MSDVIRVATKADASAILEMLNYYIVHSTNTFLIEAQTLEERLAWFDEHDETHPAVAVETDGAVTASIALHESLGFRRVGHLPEIGGKFDRWLDVVYLLLLL